MSNLDSRSRLLLPLVALLGACTDSPAGWSPATDATTRAEVGDQRFRVASDTLELATPARAPITLRTSMVTHGGRALDMAIVETTEASGELALARPEFVETLQLTDVGVEQSWLFPRSPGDLTNLVVTLDVGHVTDVARVDGGLRLRRDGEIDVFYSDATWIDAAGVRVPLRSDYAAGRIVLAVPAGVVATTSYPAILDPLIVITPTAL